MNWTSCFNEFGPSGTSVPRFLGVRGEGAEPHVSVRAMILSVIRFGIAAAEPTYIIEKGWAAYRKQKELDLYGKGLATKSTHVAGCVHP